nr:zinc finger BED domain-containing protein 4-like [Hydra vulgaris]
MAKKSIAWKFFDISTTPHMSKCKLCDSLITRGGKSFKSYGTTAMVKHLRLKHSKEFELAEEKKKVQSLPSISEASVASTTNTVQSNIIQALQKKKQWNIDDHRSIRIHKIIGKLITLDIQPFSIVEDTGFNELIKDAYPNYKLPCRTYFSQNVIPSMYDELFKDIKIKISAANYLSLTTDIWTADTAKIAFLSITGHWIDLTKFSQETAVLRVIHFPEKHTGVHIKEYLQKSLETFEIPLSKIHLIVTDNASNMKAAVKNSGMSSIPCFIHTLQLCIHDSIFSQEIIKEILTLCRGITTHFNHSPIACAKLKSIQQQLSTVPHKMKQDVPTRWNSSFEMLQRTFEQKVPLATYAAEYDEIKLSTNYQWGIVEKLVHILAPFENLTKKCGRRDETCAQIIPSVLALKVLLQKASSSDIYAGIMTMIDELIKSVTKRLDKFLLNKMLCVSTFLDPRYKLLYQHADENVIKEWVEEAWKEMQGAQDVVDSDSDNSPIVKAPASNGFISIDDCFKDVASMRTGRKQSERRSEAERELVDIEVVTTDIIKKQAILKSAITQEIDNYLSLPLLENKSSPFLWWSKCGMQFEKLKKMALKYLTAPPSSIESERLFSAGGDIYEATRSRLKADNGEYLIREGLPFFAILYIS